MKHTVYVGSATSVVTGEDGLKLGNTILVGLLQATKECVVQIFLVVRVAVAFRLDARVNTLDFVSICFRLYVDNMITYRRIAVPDIHVDLRNRLASLGVDKLDVEEKRNTLLILRDVRANQFTSDICYRLAMQNKQYPPRDVQ